MSICPVGSSHARCAGADSSMIFSDCKYAAPRFPKDTQSARSPYSVQARSNILFTARPLGTSCNRLISTSNAVPLLRIVPGKSNAADHHRLSDLQSPEFFEFHNRVHPPVLNPTPSVFPTHFSLETRSRFRLISRWKTLNLTKPTELNYN